jgi:hypothetical protein
VDFEFIGLLQDTSDQLVYSRKQKLEDRRLVGFPITENQIDSWRITPQRAARNRRREKVLRVGGSNPNPRVDIIKEIPMVTGSAS